MDATTLRLILLILGIAFLVALYLWERRRAADEEDDGFDDDDDYDDADLTGTRRDPRVGPLTEAERAERAAALAERRRATDDLYLQRFQDPADPEDADDADADDEGADDALIVQFFLLARGEPFAGEEILDAAARHHLVPGDMGIFHRRRVGAEAGRARFSMANLVKPGTFPFPALDNFATPGLALFARLAGAPSDLMVYDELVQTAQAMAEDLDAVLQQSDRTALTPAAAKKLRNQVLEHLQPNRGGGRDWA